MSDKTNFAQALMHMIKGNLGTGILAMPASFAHCGLINAVIGLPLLCVIATYCVHLLVRSSQHLESKMKGTNFDYDDLAKGAFTSGPRWLRRYAKFMCILVDVVLIISQMGICCVYLVFIVENIGSILATYSYHVNQLSLFAAILPITLALSYIRTLSRLSIASGCANFLQVLGLVIVMEFLIREMPRELNIDYFAPFSGVALGFGSAMFAFEGISVVMPVYVRMKRPEQMGGWAGLINLAYVILLMLYFTIGFFGYLRFGREARGSITLNLPQEPLYDTVRAIFTASLFLTYPLQFYVPNEIIWRAFKSRFLDNRTSASRNGSNTGIKLQQQLQQQLSPATPTKEDVKGEYICRTLLVLFTFVLAITVPRLNLLMDLVGSLSGTTLSVTLPAVIHLTVFWEDTSGVSKAFMAIVDGLIIFVGLTASYSGSYFSVIAIIESFSPVIYDPHSISPSTIASIVSNVTASPLGAAAGSTLSPGVMFSSSPVPPILSV